MFVKEQLKKNIMRNLLAEIDGLNDELARMLSTHNEVFFVENEDDFGYLDLEGEEINEIDFYVYSTTNKYGESLDYAIREINDGILFLVGLGEADGEIELNLNDLNYQQLYDLAQLCDF